MNPIPAEKTSGWNAALEKFWAAGMDSASFAFINLIQRRHRLPPDFRERFLAFGDEWLRRGLDEFYAVPADCPLPDWPANGTALRFPSPFPGEFAGNNTAAFDLYPCAEGWSAPTMFLAHGLMSVSDIGYRRWAARLNASGWNTVFMHLPYHYSRRPLLQFNGELAVGANLIRNAMGIRQSVVESRLVMDLLTRRGGRVFGGWGTSYGGWIMAILACVEPRLQKLILVEPILNLETAIWESPACVTMRHGLRRAGLSRESTRPHLRLCCPSHHRPRVDPRSILLLAGEFDRIAPPEEIAELHRSWPGSHYHCFRQGHVGYTLMPESFRLAHELWPQDFQKRDDTPGVPS